MAAAPPPAWPRARSSSVAGSISASSAPASRSVGRQPAPDQRSRWPWRGHGVPCRPRAAPVAAHAARTQARTGPPTRTAAPARETRYRAPARAPDRRRRDRAPARAARRRCACGSTLAVPLMARTCCSMRASAAASTRSILLSRTHRQRRSVRAPRRRVRAAARDGGIDQRDDRIEREVLLQLLVDEEGLRHRPGIGKARGLDQDGVEAVAALAQLRQDADQIAAHGAADAAIAGLEDLLVGADHQFA